AAAAQGRVVIGKNVCLDIMPAVVFTDPECASVGITSEKADESGREYITVKLPYGSNGKALASGESDGIVKLIIDKENGLIAGCHCVGAHAADLIAEACTAMNAGFTAERLASECVHAHPTLSELLASAAAIAR
ncbi:MAG: dihydrolipoyl dehydrogenase, partial [Muribaculaceae bacterium]|nr:dihydrolipoyl dehydrogenase [Muribaculaceae bacterium]